MPLDGDDAFLSLLGVDDEVLEAWDEAEQGAARLLRVPLADQRTLVGHIDRCSRGPGPPTDPDDAELLEHTLELRMPVWEALGPIDGARRLTEVGAWLPPRAACTAWQSDFEFPDDDPW